MPDPACLPRRAWPGALLILALGAPAPACNLGDAGSTALAFPAPRIVDAAPAAVTLAPAFGDLRFERAVDARQAPGDSRSWYVVEQAGVIHRVLPGIRGWVATPFLDLSDRTCRTMNEEGLLGLAFSPHFAEPDNPQRGAFYVCDSLRPGPRMRLSRFTVPAGQAAADPHSEQVLLELDKPFRNHDGGSLLFGPDGMLYFSLGDGGGANDPHGNGQKLDTLLAKVLRLDVSPQADGRPYGIPPDNPFVGRADARPEIWAYGLRNAWRMAFDPATGELWAGDVGQDKYEYVHLIQRGGNHGWNLIEGLHRFKLAEDAAVPPDLIPPVWEYPHTSVASDAERAAGDEGLSITGGFVYRGKAIPGLQGWYLCADYVTKHLWAIRRAPPDADGRPVVERALLLRDAGVVSSFAEGLDGELLLIQHLGDQPRVMRLLPAPDAGVK